MKIIAITSPKVVDEDVRIINTLLDNGVDSVHLRKPDSDIDECKKLLFTIILNYILSSL